MTEPPKESMAPNTRGRWDPEQYRKFREERAQPFYDLAALVRWTSGMRVVDLGCGPGDLTRWLHDTFECAETVGIDSSMEMLAAAAEHVTDGLRFELEDIVEFAESAERGRYDLIYSNAALQWVSGHDTLLPALRALLAPGGQIAIQVPSGGDHPARHLMQEVAAQEPFASAMQGFRRAPGVQAPEWYASALYHLGAAEQIVRMNVYGHVLREARELVEWFKGSALTPYRERLDPALYEEFVGEYTRRIVERFDSDEPYFLPFNRILIWARFA